jgi:hypothetical protein
MDAAGERGSGCRGPPGITPRILSGYQQPLVRRGRARGPRPGCGEVRAETWVEVGGGTLTLCAGEADCNVMVSGCFMYGLASGGGQEGHVRFAVFSRVRFVRF